MARWLKDVPPRDRERANPYSEQADAIAAGRRIFVDHCAHCHGDDADGNKKHPSLRSPRVQQEATVGDLHWLLINGNRGTGNAILGKAGRPADMASHQLRQVATLIAGGVDCVAREENVECVSGRSGSVLQSLPWYWPSS